MVPEDCLDYILGFLNKCTFCKKYGNSLEVKSYEFEVYKGFICTECATPPSLRLRKDFDDEDFFKYLKVDQSKYEPDIENHEKYVRRAWRFTYSSLINEYYKCFIIMNTTLKHPLLQPIFGFAIVKMFDPPVTHFLFRGGSRRYDEEDDTEVEEYRKIILQNRKIYEEIGYNVDELIK